MDKIIVFLAFFSLGEGRVAQSFIFCVVFIVGHSLSCLNGYPFKAPRFTHGFSEGRVAQSFIFCVVFCRSLFVLFERLPSQSAWLHTRF